MTRDSATRHLDNLYGLRLSQVDKLVSEMGYAAFTDEALAKLAERQIAEDLREAHTAAVVRKYA